MPESPPEVPDASSDTPSMVTLYPRSRWTGVSIAAVACCILFGVAVVVAGAIHPNIPSALVVAIAALPLIAALLGALAQSRSIGVHARGAKAALKIGISLGIPTALILILLPTLCRSREPANRVKCASNLRQIGQAISSYADAHGGQFPPTIETLAASSDLTPAVFVCPSSNDAPATIANASSWSDAFRPDAHQLSYVYVAGGLARSDVMPASILAYENPQNHLDEGMNVLFGDYHVEWVQKAEADQIVAQHPTTSPATRLGAK